MLFQSSKLRARTSVFTETLQKRRSSFHALCFETAFENVTPNGIGCTKSFCGYQGRSKPKFENLELRTQDLARVFKQRFVPSRTQKMMPRCDEMVTFVPSSDGPGKSSHVWKYLKKPFQHLAASHRTWNVTFCEENATSHHFVTVPYSNQGRGSGKFLAGNDLTIKFFFWGVWNPHS